MSLDRSRSPPRWRFHIRERASYLDVMLPTRGIAVAAGKIICARTASDLGILPENVQMLLSATIVDSLGTLLLNVTNSNNVLELQGTRHLANQCNSDPICHLCAKRGHLAPECSNSGDPKLCNNCYKPGHIAVNCNNEKACNNCRLTGHPARECPNEPVCNICNVSDHVARQCPKTTIASEIVGGPFRDIICRNCSQPGHISRDCVAIVICNNCGGRGHQAFECPSGRMVERGFRRF